MHACSATSCKRRGARNKKDDNNDGVKSATLQDDPLAVEAIKAAAITNAMRRTAYQARDPKPRDSLEL